MKNGNLVTEPQIDANELKETARRIASLYNARRVSGLTLRNANGDIDQTTLGYKIAIDTLTWIRKKLVPQKFYEDAPADHMPVAIGEGAFMDSIVTNLSVIAGGNSFEESIVSQGAENARVINVGAGLKPVTVPVATSVIGLGYNLIQLEQALKSENWDYISSLEKARLKMWILGIQTVAFVGLKSRSDMPGIFNQPDVNVNLNSLIPASTPISSMTPAQFASFCSNAVSVYRANCNQTAMPNRLLLPMSDFVGLGTPVSPTYPNISQLEYLEKMFSAIVKQGVKIEGSAYGDATYNSAYGINKQRAIFYRANDEDSLLFNIPVWYTPTQPGTYDNFNFQSVAYGQFSCPKAFRPLEMLYVDHT